MIGPIRKELQTGQPVFGQALAINLFTDRHYSESGRTFEVNWAPVSGATGVRVDSGSLSLRPIGPNSTGISLSTVFSGGETSDAVLDIPGGARAIRSFHLSGFDVLFEGEWIAVRNPGDLPGGWRVAVSLPQGGGFSAPSFAVPGVELNPGIIPTMLAGASLSERVLRLPDVEAPRFRLQVLSGDFPDGLRPETFRVDSISARAAPEPVGLKLLDAGGQAIWEQAGRLQELATIDLKAVLQRTLTEAVDAGNPPSTTLTLRAGTAGDAGTSALSFSGRVLRHEDGPLKVKCEGDRRSIPILGAPLDPQVPLRVTANVVAHHEGLRLHPLSDVVPDTTGDLTGSVLAGAVPVLRVLPPQAMEGEELRRVGLVAIVREPVEISVRVLEVVGDTPGAALGTGAATAVFEPADGFESAKPRVLWIELPAPLPVDRPLAIEASATSGRALWVATGGTLALRLAVTLADPSGTRLSIGELHLALSGLKTEYQGQELPASTFATSLPMVESDQFLELVLTHLELEYQP